MKELSKIIKSFNGNVLGIGIDEKYIEMIDKNNAIKECNILSNLTGKKNSGDNLGQTVYIKKIRKVFKKRNVDFILCNYEVIEKYLNTFVKDSIYINNFKLIFYGKGDHSKLIKRYKRYDTKINIIDKKDYFIVEIDNSNAKNNIFKEFIYKIVDVIDRLIEIVGDILMN